MLKGLLSSMTLQCRGCYDRGMHFFRAQNFPKYVLRSPVFELPGDLFKMKIYGTPCS